MDGIWGVLIVIVGLGVAACVKFGQNQRQRRAALVAFAFLAAAIIVFYLNIITLPNAWSPLLGLIIFVVLPVLIYLVLCSLLTDRKSTDAAKSASAMSRSTKTTLASNPASLPVLESTRRPAVEQKRHQVDMLSAQDIAAKLGATPIAASVSTAPPTPAPAATPTPNPTPNPTPVFIPMPTPTQTPQAAPAAAPIPAPTPVPTKFAAPASALSYTTVFEKAARFRDKGSAVMAARLFAEAIALAPDVHSAINAMFEEVASYVRANDMQNAQARIKILDEHADAMTTMVAIKYKSIKQMIEANNGSK